MKNTLYHDGSGFVLEDYTGASVSLSGTQTSGVQELLDLTESNGYPARAYGSAQTMFAGTATISVPPLSCTDIEINGWVSITADAPALVFDSFSRSRFVINGVLQHFGSASNAVLVKPVNACPIFPLKAIEYSTISLGSVITQSGSVNAAVRMDPTTGAINNNKFHFVEIEGTGHSQVGMSIQTPYATETYPNACFVQNEIWAGVISGWTAGGICEGSANISSNSYLGTNLYRLGGVTVSHSGTTYGAQFMGIRSNIQIGSISVNAGSLAYGVILAGGSDRNWLLCKQIEGGTPVVNAGTNNTVIS